MTVPMTAKKRIDLMLSKKCSLWRQQAASSIMGGSKQRKNKSGVNFGNTETFVLSNISKLSSNISTEIIVVQTFLVGRTFIFVERVEKSSKEDPEDDEETGLGHFGGDDVSSVETQLGQAGEENEAHDGQVVLHLLPPPSDQTGMFQVNSKCGEFSCDDNSLYLWVVQ